MSEAPAAIGEADLHAHCTVSDGTESPAAARRRRPSPPGSGASPSPTTTRRAAGPRRAAAVPEARASRSSRAWSSRRASGYASVHLLGYLVDPLDEASSTRPPASASRGCTRAEDDRRGASPRLRPQLGRRARPDDAEGATIGRPHIADALVARGHVSDRSAAFAEHPALARRATRSRTTRPTRSRACGSSVAAGGVPVLAHPGTRGAERVDHRRAARASSSTPGCSASRSTTARTAPT